MATEWVDVADNAVKIGLGSVLTILGGYLTLKLSQRHELRKEALIQQRKDFDVKAGRYIDFLSSSRMMMQKYMISPFRPDGEDYIEYTRLHETVSLMTTNHVMRQLAFDAYLAVSQACLLTSSPTLALRVTGGGFPLLGDSCSRSTGFLLHRAA